MSARSAASPPRRWSFGAWRTKKKGMLQGIPFLVYPVGADSLSARTVQPPDGRIGNPPLRYDDENLTCNTSDLRPQPGSHGGGQPVGGALHHMVLRAAWSAYVGRGGHSCAPLSGTAAAGAGVPRCRHVGHGAGGRHSTGRCRYQSGAGAGSLPAEPPPVCCG